MHGGNPTGAGGAHDASSGLQGAAEDADVGRISEWSRRRHRGQRRIQTERAIALPSPINARVSLLYLSFFTLKTVTI